MFKAAITEVRRYGAKLYLTGVHRYELLRDRVRTGEFKVCPGAMMFEINQGLRQRFLDEVRSGASGNAGQDAHELHWAVVERDVEPSESQNTVRAEYLNDQRTIEMGRKKHVAKIRDSQAGRLLSKLARQTSTDEILDIPPVKARKKRTPVLTVRRDRCASGAE